jgi:anti-sigma B factor antagonist
MITDSKTHRVEPDITVFEISGRLNLGNALMSIENSIKRLIEEGARRLVIDLKELIRTDSAGIGMLVACAGQAMQSGGQMRIAGAQGQVSQIFDLVQMKKIVPLDPDVDTACRNLSGKSAAV